MKIAYFTDTYLPQINGVTFSVDTFSRLLSDSNELRVYAPSYSLHSINEDNGHFHIERYASVPVIGYRDIQISTPNLIKLIKSIHSFKPDVIHFHTPGGLGIAALLIAKEMNVPVIGTYHTLFSETAMYVSPKAILSRFLKVYSKYFPTPKSLFPSFDFTASDLQGNESQSEMKRLIWTLTNAIYKNSTVIVAPSESIKRELVQRDVKTPIQVISNGIDLSKFTPKELFVHNHSLIYVGRLSYEKNVDIVIRSFALAHARFQDASLTLVGDGPSSEMLRDLCSTLGIAQNVIFKGWMDRELLCDLYQRSSLFITASTMETQGLTMLEAMSCGTPVVGADKFAIPDLVKPGYNGFLAKPFDENEFAEHIITAFTDTAATEQMAHNAILTAKEHDIHVVVTQMHQLYEQTISAYKKAH